MLDGEILRHQKNSEWRPQAAQLSAVLLRNSQTPHATAAHPRPSCGSGWCPSPASPRCCGLLHRPRCGLVPRAAGSAHAVCPSQMQLRRWHSLLCGMPWPGPRAVQRLETSHLTGTLLCSRLYTWYPSQAAHHASVSWVPRDTPTCFAGVLN